jgi:hypothetical protein
VLDQRGQLAAELGFAGLLYAAPDSAWQSEGFDRGELWNMKRGRLTPQGSSGFSAR